MDRGATSQKTDLSESRCTDHIPQAFNLTGSYRCIGARQATRLGGADSMTGSEKTRQTNLEIGGATRMSLPGRDLPVVPLT